MVNFRPLKAEICWRRVWRTPANFNGFRVLAAFPPFPQIDIIGTMLEGKKENYQVCSVQYYVQQLYTVNCTHMNRTNSYLDWVLSHWAHFTVLRFIFVYVLFCV